jgi:hypothetical protein
MKSAIQIVKKWFNRSSRWFLVIDKFEFTVVSVERVHHKPPNSTPATVVLPVSEKSAYLALSELLGGYSAHQGD